MSTSMVYFLTFVGAFILLAWAFYVPFRCGLLYNGPVYCMAIGGYFAAYAVKVWDWPFGLAFFGAIILGAFLGFLPALGFSRTSGIVTAVASMALIFIIQSVIRNLEFLGGPRGLLSIPKVEYLLPITFGLILIIGIFIYRLDHSRIGRAFEAINTDPDFARTLGINDKWLKVFAMTVSSILGSIAGVIYAFAMRVIQPETFGFPLLLSCVTMLFIGGRYTLWGVLISVPFLWGLPDLLPREAVQYTKIIYGATLVIILMVRPEGVITRALLFSLNKSIKSLIKVVRVRKV